MKRRFCFGAVCLAALGSMGANPPWQPFCDETRSGEYVFDKLGGSEAEPVTVALCPDLACASAKPLARVTADSYRLPKPASPRPYFRLETAGQRKIVVARRLVLEGAYNFRDLGGFATDSGKAVRWGQLFRADALDRQRLLTLELARDRARMRPAHSPGAGHVTHRLEEWQPRLSTGAR